MFVCKYLCINVFFFKQKTAYEMRISDWSSDVCSSDLHAAAATGGTGDVVAVQEDGATIAVVDAVDDAQESRLAASGGAEQHQELEPLDRKSTRLNSSN